MFIIMQRGRTIVYNFLLFSMTYMYLNVLVLIHDTTPYDITRTVTMSLVFYLRGVVNFVHCFVGH